MKGIRLCFLYLLIAVSFLPAYGEETIDIAAIYALTGVAAEANSFSLQGVRYGVEEINRQGGVLGKKIRLLVFDNLSTPIGSSVAAEKAAAANVVAIVGASWSSHSIAIAKVAQAKQIPMISNYSTNPSVTLIGNFIFRVCFTDDFQGNVMARFARQDLEATTATVFTNLTSDYSIGLSKIFQENFKELGGEVLLEVEYKIRQKDFKEQIRQARRANSDVIFLSGHDESGLIAKLAQDAGISSIPLGGDGWADPSFLSKGGDELNRAYYSSHWSEFSDTERSRRFVARYKDLGKYGVGTALGYDALMVLADAIRRAGSTERTEIRDALAKTCSFEGVTGNITFNANGDPLKSAVIMEIVNGKPHYLKTLEP